MPSERALLIKQRQQEAIRRQKQEIAERDAIRQQRELGITQSQPIQAVVAPQTLHDLFNSRYEPKSNQTQNAQSNPETARLRAYEQKRARFLARKRAEMQSAQHTQHQTTDIQPQIHTLQQTHNIPQSQPPPMPHEPDLVFTSNHPTPHIQQQTYNKPPTPPQAVRSHQFQEFPANHPMQHIHELPQTVTQNIHNISAPASPKHVSSEKYKSDTGAYNQIDLMKEKKAKQEKYREELYQQMRAQEMRNELGNNQSNIKINENHSGYFGMSGNDKTQKRAKQEQYRQELLQQMQNTLDNKTDININDNYNGYFGASDNDKTQKRAKQEQYRQELLQQMQNTSENNKTDTNTDKNHNGYFGASDNDKKQKRAKQEQYRQELWQQMREQQMINAKTMSEYNKNALFGDEMKQMENRNEDKYNYAKQLDQQMQLKKLTKMAEKEKQLLEDRKMSMRGGFLDGFGNNKIPQIQISYSPPIPSMPSNNKYATLEQGHNDFVYMGHSEMKKEHILEKKALYKMELDRQCKELQEKKMREKLLNEKEESRLNDKIKRDRKQIINEKYKDDLDEQMKELQERRKSQKMSDHEHGMKLEMQIERNRQMIENANNNNNNSANMGIFGNNSKREKIERARKKEQYQEELKEQALEIKRKKREKEEEEKEKERKLELKIQKELQELEEKYRHEKEFEAMNMSNLSNVANGVNIAKKANVNKSNINLQNIENIAKVQNNIARNADIVCERSQIDVIDDAANEREKKRSRPSTSKQMLREILSLKQDLLDNREQIRHELQMHKKQINEQIANVSSSNSNCNQTENDKLELNKYEKISNELQRLKSVILKQQKPETKHIMDDGHIIDKSSQFIPCTVPDTPMTISCRPDTALTSFSTTSMCHSHSDNNTGFTEFGVDEYLLNECKQNNEFLQSNNNNDTRLHTPNIFRVDTAERDLNLNGNNICEKSIKSKSDFLYNISRQQDVDDMDKSDKTNNINVVNKNKLNYFRCTTPLDATRSMKIGLQKIQDLLNKTNQNMSYDGSLSELI